MSPTYEPQQRYGEHIKNLWGSPRSESVFNVMAQTAVSQAVAQNVPDGNRTLLEKRWIGFFTYIGLPVEVISESLNGICSPEVVRAIQESAESQNAVVEMRIEYKNSIQAPPPYPYTDDRRSADDPTRRENRSHGALYDLGIDTDMSWSVWRDEDLAYLDYISGEYSGKSMPADLLAYYILFTPMETRSCVRAYTRVKSGAKKHYDSPVPCPYVLSYSDYVQAGLSRRFTAINPAYLYNPLPISAGEHALSALSRMESMEHPCIDTEKLSNDAGHTVTPQNLTLSMVWCGASREYTQKVVGASFGVALTNVNKMLTDTVKTRCDGGMGAPQPVSYISPDSKAPLTAYHPNVYYKPTISFTGRNGKSYTFKPWENVTQRYTGVSLNERRYLEMLSLNYPAREVARYVALYTPSKDFNGFTRGVTVEDYLDKAKRTPEEMVCVAEPCPYPVPFEAVYDPSTETVLYYEHLNALGGSAINTDWDFHATFVTSKPTPEEALLTVETVQEEPPVKNDEEVTVETSSQQVDEVAKPAATKDEFMESMVRLVTKKPAKAKVFEEVSAPPQETPQQESTTVKLPTQEEVSEVTQEKKPEPPRVAKPKPKMANRLPAKSGVADGQQSLFNESITVYKPLPGDSKLAINFALPEIQEHTDHGALSRAQQEEERVARATPFPPLPDPPKHTGPTLGDVSVKTSRAVPTVMQRIIEANEEKVLNAPLSVVAQMLNISAMDVVTVLTREHGWDSAIEGLAALVSLHPDAMFSTFVKRLDSNIPFSAVPQLAGVTMQEAMKTLISANAGLNLQSVPLSLIAEALGKTQEAIIVDSVGLGSLL